MHSISHLIEEATIRILDFCHILDYLIRVISLFVCRLGLILVVLVFDLAISINKGIRLVFWIPSSINNIFGVICVWTLYFLNPKFITLQQILCPSDCHWWWLLLSFLFDCIFRSVIWVGFCVLKLVWCLSEVLIRAFWMDDCCNYKSWYIFH